MAWTVSFVKKTVVGDMRCAILSCVADAATQNVNTGMSVVYGASILPKSLTSGAPKVQPNSGAGGTALMGYLGCSGFTSGDECFIVVYGR